MKLGLQLAEFTLPGGPGGLRDHLTRVAETAEEHGFSRLSVMDHLLQIRGVGPAENDMLEAYTTLGYLAARTERVELLTWVTAASYRSPGLLAKIISTLDVLSSGRAILGIGAGWNESEAAALGLSLPPMAQRFEILEETVQICRQMWSGSDAPYQGRHHQLGRTLNVPAPLRTPPILIGGGGEKKTLRMVAQYADICNLAASADLPHKLDVLRAHCATLGRNYDSIEKTVLMRVEADLDVDALLASLDGFRVLGIDQVHVYLADPYSFTVLDTLGAEVIPAIAGW